MENTIMLGKSTEDTLAFAQSLQKGEKVLAGSKKSITTALNLVGYPLEAPAKKLYFVEDTMRRRIPRKLSEVGGTACHWRAITTINTNAVRPGVAEGALNTMLDIATEDRYATYKSLNMAQPYTDEATIMGRRFQDVPELAMLTTMQALMIAEDLEIVGGASTAISAPATVTAVDDASVTTGIPSATYVVSVSAVGIYGWRFKSAGHGTADAIDETTATSATSVSLTATHAISATWDDVPGACGYNVYVDGYYYGFSATNTITITSIPASTANVPNTNNTTGSANDFDGILTQLVASTSNAYYKSLDGAQLTSDNAGGIVEIEEMLASIYDNYVISPTVMLVGLDILPALTKAAIGNSATAPTRFVTVDEGKNGLSAGSAVTAYYNKYTGQYIEIVSTVHCPAGKIIAVAENVPYPSSETPNNLEIDLQQEMYGEIMARTQRQTTVSVSEIEALKIYLTGGCGIIANIGA